MNEIIKKVKDTISKYQMIAPKDRVVVAVSGGPDSVCLLAVLNELREDLDMELITAHFNHGLRPKEDESETRFVKDLSESFNLPFVVERANHPLMEEKGPLEETARHTRYGFLERVKQDFSALKIAVGHNLNDQAETVMMRLLRGSGPSGLAGIPPCRNNIIIRPLIEISRREIMDYLEHNGLQYVVDSTNSETRFLRNRIRLEVLPMLAEIQPRIMERLGRTAQIMRREDEWMKSESVRWVTDHAEDKGKQGVQFPLSDFNRLEDALKHRVIRQALIIAGGTLRRICIDHVDAVTSLAEGARPQARIDLPNSVVAERIYDRLIFRKAQKRPVKSFSYVLDGPGTVVLAELDCTVSFEEIDAIDLPTKRDSKRTALLDADRLTYPLIIRNIKAGDRFIPLGMSGHRKLKDFFIDLKIPLAERSRIPILTHHDMPVWVCGYRIDDRYKVTPATKRVIKVTLIRETPFLKP